MLTPSRVLGSAVALFLTLAAPAAADLDVTHGERIGTAQNEIVDVSKDGTFLVATQGTRVVRWDLSNLDAPGPSITSDVIAPGGDISGDDAAGVSSVALVRDEYVIAAFNANNDGPAPSCRMASRSSMPTTSP